jgi:hypothetical protein
MRARPRHDARNSTLRVGLQTARWRVATAAAPSGYEMAVVTVAHRLCRAILD